MSARENILKRLRAAQQPFTDVAPIEERDIIAPLDADPQGLRDRFIAEAEALSATVHQPADAAAAVATILSLIGDETQVLAWAFDEIPVAGLGLALSEHNITVADPRADGVRIGITGVDAALAATGSLVVSARAGRPRSVSLLPHQHIAVVRSEQILPHFDAWIEQQRSDPAAFRAVGNHIVISGASRTADIAMELVLGAHGPADLQIILL